MQKQLFYTLLILLSFTSISSLIAQDSLNMSLVGHWYDSTIQDAGSARRFNSCGGFSKDGREYALLGSSQYAIFLDITNPSNITEVGRFGDGVATTWREMKTYQDHAYFVSDANPSGLMVFDMSALPDTVYRTYFGNEIVGSAHMLNIDTINGRLYVCGGSAGNGLFVFDIATNPSTPTLLSHVNLPGGYVHDLHVKNNIAYCSHGYNGLYIYDYSDASFPVLLASMQTNGYNHSSWLTKDDRYLLVCEEVPLGLPMLLIDLQNMQSGSLEIVKQFKHPLLESQDNNCYHNPYVKDDYAWVATYEDGVTVWDIQDPLEPSLVGYYKIDGSTAYTGYASVWGVYPYLPSGRVLASDMQRGLYIFESPLNQPIVNNHEAQIGSADFNFELYPNPAAKFITVDMSNGGELASAYSISNSAGKEILKDKVTSRSSRFTVPLNNLENGIYFLSVNNGKTITTKKFFKQ
ncbi:MAG: choice-of-anchor B family protein [Saprospiraceae bacterium]|nr:choice-of-anchor B family protein [Saprospiraceae bacterium]